MADTQQILISCQCNKQVSAVVSLQSKYGTFCCFNSKTVLTRELVEAGTNFYEEWPFYLLECIPKPWENTFGMPVGLVNIILLILSCIAILK